MIKPVFQGTQNLLLYLMLFTTVCQSRFALYRTKTCRFLKLRNPLPEIGVFLPIATTAIVGQASPVSGEGSACIIGKKSIKRWFCKNFFSFFHFPDWQGLIQPVKGGIVPSADLCEVRKHFKPLILVRGCDESGVF